MLRRVIVVGAGVALLVGLTAGPLEAGGTGKIYSVTMSPAAVPYTTGSVGPLKFTVVFANQTPGNSQFNSLALSAPANYTISGPFSTQASSGNVGNVSIAHSATGIQVTNLYPVGYGQTFTLTFYATIDTSNLTCSTAVGTWGTQAWTGSNLSGTPFALTSIAPTTTVGTLLAAGGSITVNGVTVTNNSTQCEPISISQSGVGNTVNIFKPTVTGLANKVDILWNPEPAPLPGKPVPLTQVDTPAPTHAIQWCGGTAAAPSMPSGEVSCLISETTQIAGSNNIQVHDVIQLVGDWGANRG
jgi:hypothetical protein